VIAKIAVIEHNELDPGEVATALRLWRTAARAGVSRPPGCGHVGCCGYGPRAQLQQAIDHLSGSAKLALQRVVRELDQIYLSHTLPDSDADPQAPWWERRARR
jgi:hypothetical protein